MWTAAVLSRGFLTFGLVLLMDKLANQRVSPAYIASQRRIISIFLARISLCEEIGKDAELNFRINQL